MVTCECSEMVGRRVAVGDDLGTVRYVGVIPTMEGTWLGIEWDDPNRGKHNGTYKGQRYFNTRHPKSGSFIHIEKADFGRSFVSALKERYGSNQPMFTTEELEDLQKAMNAPLLEMVGFDKVHEKMSCFTDLDIIGVQNYQVCCAGEDLASICPKAKDVDLSRNLFISWDEVAKIIVNLSQIYMLNLSFNRLNVPENPESLHGAFKTLTHIVLGSMDYTWEQILICSKMWPKIQNLQVPFNNIDSLNMPENNRDVLTNLTHLDLEGNSIPDWEEINKLGMLEQLECLNLCDVGLTNIKFPSSQTVFKNLQCLLLSDNKIEKWEYIAQLEKLPKLHEIRFSNNPVLKNLDVDVIHYNIIARIGSLKIVNRKVITKEERRGAELEYIKEFEQVWLMSLKNDINTQFLLLHPRFPDLVDEYGLSGEEKQENPKKILVPKPVKLLLSSSDKTIIKTLPITITVNMLTSIIRKLFKLGPKDPVLHYRSCKNPEITEEMQQIFQPLSYYSIQEGDEIFFKS